MSVAAAALALPREFEALGRPFSARPLTYDDLARFGLWVEERALAALFRTAAGGYGSADELHAAHQRNVAAGAYEPGGGAFDQATRSDAGRRKLLELMLVPPEGTKDGAKWRAETSWELFADEAGFRKACEAMKKANDDPLAVAARRRPTPPAAPSP